LRVKTWDGAVDFTAETLRALRFRRESDKADFTAETPRRREKATLNGSHEGR
jgi:hypothetical protein